MHAKRTQSGRDACRCFVFGNVSIIEPRVPVRRVGQKIGIAAIEIREETEPPAIASA